MPKRKKARNKQKAQPTHTPHPHNEKAPPRFPRTPPKFRKKRDCTLQVSRVHKCQVSAHPNLHPEVSQCAQIQGFGLSKTTLQVSTYPIKHPEFHNTPKSEVSDYPKQPSKFPPIQQSTPSFTMRQNPRFRTI